MPYIVTRKDESSYLIGDLWQTDYYTYYNNAKGVECREEIFFSVDYNSISVGDTIRVNEIHPNSVKANEKMDSESSPSFGFGLVCTIALILILAL